jgi:hypothetical protein
MRWQVCGRRVMSVGVEIHLGMLLKRFARTIEIEVSPEEFVYRYRGQERRIPTRGYIAKIKGEGFCWSEEQETQEYVPICLFSSVPPEFHADIVELLVAFLMYGIWPFCRTLIRPVLIFCGVERFATGFGFEYPAFREAAKAIALGEKEIYFKAQGNRGPTER